MNRKSLILPFLLIYILGQSLLMSQTIEFTPGNESTSYLKYNIAMSTASTAAGVGGFTASCTAGCNDDNTYRIRVSFDGGTNWYSSFSSMTATTGGATSNGRFFTDGGLAQISVSHEVLAGLSAWPGNDNAQGIQLQVYESETSTYYPTSPVSWTLDLTRPTISAATIASDNGTNTAFATTNDVITIGITSSEDLANAGSFVFSGNISGLVFNTRSGADLTQWEFFNTVTTHAEQVVTYSIVYYDANYNVGASNLTTTTDGSTVTVDKTSPTMAISIASNNTVPSLAKHADIATITIASNEILNGPPTVQISSNTSPTVSPSTASTDYTATHTLNQSSDPQTAVTFSISSIVDRAGNTVSTISNTTDASSVTFDYTAPQLDVVSSSSNNSLTTSRAKADDIVTISFTSNEAVQDPVVLIAGESAVESNANGDNVTWTATKTMDAEDDDGQIDFTLNFTDLAGNSGTEITKTGITTGSAVVFDNTPPTLASLTVSSSNSTNGDYGIEDDIISLAIISVEDLQGDATKSPYGLTSATIAGRSVDGNGNEIISKVNATNWSAQVQLNGSEASAPVSYSFTMTDLTGNQTVINENVSAVTIDNDVPSLNSVSIASVGTDNDEYAKSGDVIKVSFTSTENLSASNPPTGTIALSNSSVSMTSGDATDRTVFESTLTTSNTTTEGVVAFTLDLEDYAGNTATVNAATDGSSVIFDRTSPLMSYVRMSSSGSDTNYAKVGDIVTLSMKATDKLKAAPTVTIFTNAATVSGGNTDSIWTAVYTMPAGLADGLTPFTLDFADMAGNNGTQITSTSNDAGDHVRYDEVVPTLTTASITSNNSNGATIAKVGDVITLSIVSLEAIQTPSITIAGRSGAGAAELANSTSGLSSYSATYTMLDGDTEGNVTFSADFLDLASNSGVQVVALIDDADDSGVTFDKTPPYFNQTTGQGAGVISISSDNADNTVAILGDVVTLTLTSTEAIKTGSDPTVTINGNNASVTRNTATSFTASYTMSSTDGSSNIAEIPFSISDYEDLSGNVGSTVTNSTTDGTAVKYDPIRPTLSNVVMVSNNSNNAYAKEGDEIELSFETSETINTPTVTMIGAADGVTVAANGVNAWKATRAIGAGDAETDIAFTVSFTDPAGNTGSNGSGGSIVSATSSGDVVTVDRTGPTVSTVDVATDNEINPRYAVPADVITVTVIANEAIQAPTVTIMQNSSPTVSAVNGFNNLKWEATHTAGNAEAVGNISIEVDVLDLAGNANAAGQITAGVNDSDGNNVYYDNTAPTLSNISFTSNNTISTAHAKDGDIVTLSFDASEELLQSTVEVTLNYGVTNDEATVNKTLDWNGVKETWSAAFVVPSTYEASVGDNSNISYQIDYNDIFTVPGAQITNGVTGNIEYDGNPPTLSSLTYSSNNANNTALATTGDEITVEFTGSEALAITADPAIEVPVLTVGGNVVTTTAVNGTNDGSWIGTYAMQNTDTEGEIAILLDYKDYAGNSGTTRTQSTTSDGLTITFDKTAPTLTAVSIASNNKYSASRAKVGDQVTITFTGSHPLRSSPVVTINPDSDNVAATVEQGADNTQWTASYTLLDGNAEGAIAFAIDFQDLATNAGTQVVDVTDGSSVTFDKTATDVSSLVIALDSGSDTGSSNSDRLTNDTTPTFIISGLNAVTATTDTLILFVDGVRVDSAEVTGNTASLTSTAIAHSINAYAISVKSRDLAGNVSTMSASSVATPNNSIEIRMDTQAPAAGDAFDLKASDDTGLFDTDNVTRETTPIFTVAGLAPDQLDSLVIYYDAVDLGVTDAFIIGHRMTTPVSDDVTITTALGEDVYSFSYVVIDSAGNESAMSAAIDVTIDLTSPSVPAVPNLVDAFDTGVLNSDNLTNLTEVQFQITGLSVADNKVFLIDTADGDTLATENIDATSINVDVSGLTSSSYAASVSDLAGNSSILSDVLNVTLDNTATDVDGNDFNGDEDFDDVVDGEFYPIIVDLISSSDTGLNSSDNITNQIKPTFRISNLVTSSALNDSIFLYATVAGNPDNLVASGVVDGATEDLEIDNLNQLSENNYQIKLRTKDYAGNLSDFTTEFTLTIDTTAFVIVEDPDLLVEDDSGVSRSDNITNIRNPRFNFKSLDVATDSLILYITNPAGATSFANSARKVQDDFSDTLQVLTNLTAGDYVFTYKVVDLAGNESDLSNGLSVTIDYTAPSEPSGLDLIASDDNGPSNSDNLTNASSMSITSSGLVTGEYGFLYLWNNENLDNVIDIGEGTKIDSALLVSGDAGIATFTLSNAIDTTYNYYVTAQDIAGNTSSITAAPKLQVQVDLTPPVVTGLAIVLDPDSDTGILGDNAGFNIAPTFTVSDTILNSLTATDSVILYYGLTISSQNPGVGLNGTPKRFAALPIDAASESLTGIANSVFDENGGGVDDGRYAITAKLRDFAGNISSASTGIVYRLDTTPPQTYPDPSGSFAAPDLIIGDDKGYSDTDNITNKQDPSFIISDLNFQLKDKVILYAKKGFTTSVVDSANVLENNTTVQIQVPWVDDGNGIVDDGEGALAEGQWTITYTVTDSAGNVTEVSPGLNLEIDATTPAVLGKPDLIADYDTGESDTDGLTNLPIIKLDQTDTIPGFKWTLFSVVDDGDGLYDSALDAPLFEEDSQLFPGGSGPNGLDLNNDGVPDGARSISVDITVSDTTHHFLAVQEDIAGNVSAASEVLTVSVDSNPPNCDITYNDPDNDGTLDNLVKFADGSVEALFTFDKSMDDEGGVPRMVLNYPNELLNPDTVSLSKVDNLDTAWTYSIPLNDPGMESSNGDLNIELLASDRFGNPVSVVTGNSEIRIDNLSPVFSNIVPGSNSYNNADSLGSFSWNLDEPGDITTIVEATVTFNNLSDNTNYSTSLDPADLIEGDRFPTNLPGWTSDPYFIPHTEGLYEVVFSSIDSAGNVGRDTLINFTYDTLRPSAQISFSRLHASNDTSVTVVAVFSEDMLSGNGQRPVFNAEYFPYAGNTISGEMDLQNIAEEYTEANGIEGWQDGEVYVDYNGNEQYDPVGDLRTFKYTFVVDGQDNQTGLLDSINITNAKDLADNNVNTVVVDSLLLVNNQVGQIQFSYENLTNPNLTNVGIAGDTVKVTATSNEPLLSDPSPVINMFYNTASGVAQGDSAIGINLSEANSDTGITWVYQVVLASGDENDGQVSFEFNGKDLANNVIAENQILFNQLLVVDNLAPTYYETDSVSIVGGNVVEGWLTGNTTAIGVTVPIENANNIDPPPSDTTLQGGLVEIQFYNTNRGLGWVEIGSKDTLDEYGSLQTFTRPIEDLYAVMDTNFTNSNGLQPGDLLAVRVKVYDKHANVTAFGTSTDSLRFDPSGPVPGTIVSGVFGITTDASTDTVYSNDLVEISWTPFVESDPQESGLKEYRLTILKRDSLTGPNPVEFLDTLITNPPDTSFSKELFLTHGTRYVANIVGIDTAGNFSGILSSDTLLRLNTAPIIDGLGFTTNFEDNQWIDTVDIIDPDLDVLQGDNHIFSMVTDMSTAAIDSGQSRGGAPNYVLLPFSSVRQNDFYAGCKIAINTSGVEQVRKILSYEGATRTAIVADGSDPELEFDPPPTVNDYYSIQLSAPVIDSLTGVMSWTPRQTNAEQASFNITVTVNDDYNFSQSETFLYSVQPVNDPPEGFLRDSLSTGTGIAEWQEDSSYTLVLSDYFIDVDNDITDPNGGNQGSGENDWVQQGGLDWVVIIRDTAELDEDFPLGTVIPGPGASNEFIAKVSRKYLGFDPNNNLSTKGFNKERAQQITRASSNPLISLQWSYASSQDDGSIDQTLVTFVSDSNYYGTSHEIVFLAKDQGWEEGDLITRDSLIANILPKNDPPIFHTELPDTFLYENDSLWLKFGPFITDVDNEELTFKVSALTNDDKIMITPGESTSQSAEDSILFKPSLLWSNKAEIQVVVEDGQSSDTSSFILDIERVLRPHFSVSVAQNNAFNKFFQILVIDTVSKASFVSMDVANSNRDLDTIADYTYTANIFMEASGNYPIDVSSTAAVGDTTIREYFSLVAGRSSARWSGSSFDGKFSVVGDPGAVNYDQPLLITDSTLFNMNFHDKASYVLGNEGFGFNKPIEVRLADDRDDVAIYRRKNGSIWEELPSISRDGEIFTLSEKAGYFKLGRKTIIVPEQTNIHQNYPNPFNPTTTIMYDIGLLDGLKQNVSISVYNLLGQHITTLIENKDQIGQFKIQWNGSDKFGQQMSSGVYFIQLVTKTGIVKNKKMMLLK